MPVIEPKDQSLKSLTGLHLWHDDMSSCSQRVRTVLALKGLDWEDHLLVIPKGDTQTPEFLAINPVGVVPVLVDEGVTRTESMDIIDYLDERDGAPSLRPSDAGAVAEMKDWMEKADVAQYDLKVLSHEFLFRAVRHISAEDVAFFESNYDNEVLVDFIRIYAQGDALPVEMITQSVNQAEAGFRELDAALAAREWLAGDAFSLADIAWMPNAHRFELIGWPMERTPNLMRWHAQVKALPGYQAGIVDWEPPHVREMLANYVETRGAEGHHVRNFGVLAG